MESSILNVSTHFNIMFQNLLFDSNQSIYQTKGKENILFGGNSNTTTEADLIDSEFEKLKSKRDLPCLEENSLLKYLD